MDDETREAFSVIHESINAFRYEMNQRFKNADERFDEVDERLVKIEQAIDHGFGKFMTVEEMNGLRLILKREKA